MRVIPPGCGPMQAVPPGAPPRIAVSACLLGVPVRYDGDHRRSDRVVERLGAAFSLLAECPEAGMGLGVPRPKIHLEREATAAGPRLIGSRSEDLTAAGVRYARAAAERFRRAGVCGIVLKSRSPSCGPGDARILSNGVEVSATGQGIFARTVSEALPEVPQISEVALEEPRQRDHWITRVFALREIREIRAIRTAFAPRPADRRGLESPPERRPSRWRSLYAFHARWKMLLMAHSEAAARRLGHRLATAGDPAAALAAYRPAFLAALAEPDAPNAHRNVLEHLAGHLKRRLDADSRRELHAAIRAAAAGAAPLAAPIRLLAAHARRLEVASLADQAYLDLRHPALGYRGA